MKKTTFISPEVAKYLDDKFYLVDLNAETKDTIFYQNQNFIHESTSPFHQWVYAALKNNIIFPSSIIINDSLQVVDPVPYFVGAPLFEPILKFYGSDAYKTTKWQDFKDGFKSTTK